MALLPVPAAHRDEELAQLHSMFFKLFQLMKSFLNIWPCSDTQLSQLCV